MGIGEAMMKTAIEHARKEGKLEILHLGVRRENVNAIALYKKLGCEEIGVCKRFFKIGDHYYDEILMDLHL
jgi:ribosomal protein S18 acetylase RimI-like enzyme